MFGFLTFGTTLTFLDQAFKARIEKEEKGTFPRELAISKGKIKLYQNHNEGFSFGILKGSRAVQLVPLCVTSAFAGAWAYLMGTRGRILEKLALTLTLAGGVSNLYDRMKRGYVVDYFSFQWKALKTVVFNLGDLFIFAGAFLMAAGTAAGFLKDLIKDLYWKTEEKKNEAVRLSAGGERPVCRSVRVFCRKTGKKMSGAGKKGSSGRKHLL